VSAPERRSICTTILIHAPIDHVWQVLTDYASYADWNPYLVLVEGAARSGTSIVAQAVDAQGNATMLDVKVRRAHPYAMNWVGGLPDRTAFEGDHWLTLEDDHGRTRLQHVEHFTGSQMPAILDQYAESIRDNFERMNSALKAFCERS